MKNTGRLKELLVPGASVILEDFQGRMDARKMRYSLSGVEKNGIPININSQAPNLVVKEALTARTLKLPQMEMLTLIKGEKVYGDSRLDFYVEDESGKKGFLEVKGVTLEDEGIASISRCSDSAWHQAYGRADSSEKGGVCSPIFCSSFR